MSDTLKAMLEGVINQAVTDNIAFVGVTLQESPPRITFYRNTSDSAQQLALMFETLARDLRKSDIQEIKLNKPS